MSLKQKWDNYSVQQTARNEGVKEGIEQGEKQGIVKEKHDVALKMKQKGMPINDIMEITGLTKKQIEELQ